MIHGAALDQVMNTLTQEARASLSNATPQGEAVKQLEEVVRVHPYAVLFADNTRRYIGANAAAHELTGFSRRELLAASFFDITPPVGTQIAGRYLAATNVIPGVHVSVLAKI